MTTLVVVGVVATGCGGSSSKKLGKADLAKKADSICVKYNAKVKALGQPNDAKSFGPYLDKLLPLTVDQRKELAALKPDDAIKTEWQGDLKDYDTQQQGLKDAQAALKKGNQTEFQRIIEDLTPLSKASDKKLDALGAPHCGSKSDEAA